MKITFEKMGGTYTLEQMEWIRAVNNFQNVVEEIVSKELVYI